MNFGFADLPLLCLECPLNFQGMRTFGETVGRVCVLLDFVVLKMENIVKQKRPRSNETMGMKPNYGTLFVLKLFQSVMYHINVFLSFISHPLFGIICCCFFICLLLIFSAPERDCQFNINVGCLHQSISCIHYSVSCTHYSVICKHFLC